MVDNCEHLLDAARDVVGALLSACPRLCVLATSREPLGLSAEHAFRLAPLALPRPGQEPSQVAAVAVFLDRARRVRPGAAPTPADLELVADVVRHLDGMPLAIELAAGRLSTFSLADLHRRLDRALDLLGGRPSGEARHRTLRATVEWSYQLLGDDERRLFRYLSVFVDGIALDAAEQLATELELAGDPGTVLSRLVDASMLEAEFAESTEFTGTGTRYRMLETLRAFGLDRLAAEGEDRDAGDRLLALGRRADRVDRRDAADRARTRGGRRAAPRAGEPAGGVAVGPPARRSSTPPPRSSPASTTRSPTAISWRSAVGPRSWPRDPALVGHPRAAAVLGTAGEAAYHRGDHATAERLGPDRAGARHRRHDLVVLRGAAGGGRAGPRGVRGGRRALPRRRRTRRSGWTRRSALPRSPAAYVGRPRPGAGAAREGRADAVVAHDAGVVRTTWPGRSRTSPATPRRRERRYRRRHRPGPRVGRDVRHGRRLAWAC